ncbi:ribosome silencing factor [uncultured Hymenobacter sp.]|uniref:ribosome silencing factor n=1 Tax=uncultured Hymenobacter sp. TaxID=170016 RepID=UPI0035CB7E2F
MKSTLVRQDSDTLAEVVVRGIQEKKGLDIVVLNLKELKNAVADYFIICSAGSDTQLDAVARSVEDEVQKVTGQNPWQSEGRTNGEWVLLDYVDVVVHVFLRDRRQFYALEELWGDADISYIEAEAAPAALGR